MGDMGETFRAWDAQKKEKKASNLEFSTKKLIELGVDFESKNGGFHLVISHNGKIVDFWPSTGKYKFRTRKKYCRGLKKLTKELGVEYK